MAERGRLARIFFSTIAIVLRKAGWKPALRRHRFGIMRPPNVYLALSDQTAYILGHSRTSEMTFGGSLKGPPRGKDFFHGRA
jgi:hypothetical protein